MIRLALRYLTLLARIDLRVYQCRTLMLCQISAQKQTITEIPNRMLKSAYDIIKQGRFCELATPNQ